MTRIYRELDNGEEEELGRWDYQVDPDNNMVIMRRSATRVRLSAVSYNVSDTDAELSAKLI